MGDQTPSSADRILLRVENAVKEYSGQRALDDMSFELRAGEIHALLGENGAGKSTLVKAIGGAIGLTSGRIEIGDEQVEIDSPQRAKDLGINIVHQHGNLVPELSILENVLMAEGLDRYAGVFVNWPASARRVRRILDNVGMDHLDVRRLVSTLKPHEAAMVAVAKAQASNAKIIILDEPTSALQTEEVEILFRRMRMLTEQGIGLVFITHRLAEVFQITDRVTIMRDGGLVGTWASEDLDHGTLVDNLIGPERADAANIEHLRHEGEFGDAVLSVERLRNDVLKGIDFDIRAGEVLGVASLPGEGAAEIVEALFGISRFAGKVTVSGEPVKLRSPRHAVKAGMALVPRDRLHHGIVPEFSVRENATLASTSRFITDPVLRFMRRGLEREAVGDVTKLLSLKAQSLEQPIRTLSGGNQQKVVVAKWIISGAKVYLLDSPSNAVDIHTKAEIYARARELAKEGAAVLFTSTEVEEFVRVCDRVLVLNGGRIAGELTADEISVPSIMRLSFGSDHV